MTLERAQVALEAAHVCLARGLYHSATSRAYYAMFWAAQVALAHVGIRRSEWSHPAVQASFVQELIRGLGGCAATHVAGTGTASVFPAILPGGPWVVVTVPALVPCARL